MVVAWLLAAGFLYWTHAYWTPLHPGVDQNGYLVGGKQFAATLMPRQTPTVPGHPDRFDPHAFVANMWVAGANDTHSFDPKYPIGLPLLYAITIWIGGVGTPAAYWLSPVAMALTLPGVFVVVRRFADSYGGLLATLAFATSPTVGNLVNNPNSHAVAVCTATWGMAAVLRWWHDGGRRWAVLGGLLVGFVTTVRYSEGMLVLPLVWAALVRARGPKTEELPVDTRADDVDRFHAGSCGAGSDPAGVGVEDRPRVLTRMSRSARRVGSSVFESLVLLASWSVPVLLLAAYNLTVLGTLTGYDATNESTGFAWAYFFDNWETMLRNLSGLGLLLLLPLAVAGLIGGAWRDWRRAIFLWLWAAPCLGLYAFYYWGPDGVGYLRFLTNALPALLAAAFWPLTMTPATAGPLQRPRNRRTVLRPAVKTLSIAAIAAVVGAGLYLSIRHDPAKHAIVPLAEYLDRPPTTYQRLGGGAALFGGIVAAMAVAAALAATRRRDVIALAVGVVTLLSVADAAELSSSKLEQDGYDNATLLATADAVRDAVPNGAMLLCREESLLQYLQFVTDDRLYTGLSFDRNWVNGRPRAMSDDPVLIDPVRGQQLFDALKAFDQNALNNQARVAVKDALQSGRRVFVAETAPPDALRQAVREKKEGPVPEFVRRYVNRPKDLSLVGRRVGWWTVPQVVKDEVRNVPRGRKLGRPNFRTTCYQVWEITNG